MRQTIWHVSTADNSVFGYYDTRTWYGRLLSPLLNWFTEYELRWQQDIFLQQGLAFEDKEVHSESDLRRDVLFEHMARESYNKN